MEFSSNWLRIISLFPAGIVQYDFSVIVTAKHSKFHLFKDALQAIKLRNRQAEIIDGRGRRVGRFLWLGFGVNMSFKVLLLHDRAVPLIEVRCAPFFQQKRRQWGGDTPWKVFYMTWLAEKVKLFFGAAHFENEREFAPHASFSDPNMGLPDWTTVQQAQF